jgi:hypothetical protein
VHPAASNTLFMMEELTLTAWAERIQRVFVQPMRHKLKMGGWKILTTLMGSSHVKTFLALSSATLGSCG